MGRGLGRSRLCPEGPCAGFTLTTRGGCARFHTACPSGFARSGQDAASHVFTEVELAQILQDGRTVEREDAVHRPVGVLHLADGLRVFLLGRPVQTSVLEHAGVDEPLVDGVQLVLVARLPAGNGLCVAMRGVCLLPDVV